KERPTYHLTPGSYPYSHSAAVILYHEIAPIWSPSKLNRNYMIRNYFKIAWRNVTSNKLFASLNIAGLAIGICVCITLFACASYELSFERMFKNAKNIYRINLQAGPDYNNGVWAQQPGKTGPAVAAS